ncbi:transcription factor RAX2-like [Zingiber officinale]|uniref:Uncharacterized protein n=1 Tax=Zingiber officinale TaxID=94328 RepID=A0A8J5I1A0_ZINOF|nr:transcription factor RAX2-like [Zingiber officinale]KAG6525292.1 hypothetical protein ZIOFF_015246 [Zingiber officinale]
MGRAPCCDKASVKKGHWSPEEDKQLKEYIEKHGTGGNWIALPHKAGLNRCGKSCRLRWLNYLRPNIKHGSFSDEEDRVITNLYASIGSRWSIIANHLPGRTDNDIKNYWNTKLKKKFSGILTPARRVVKHHHQQQCSSYACFPTAAAAALDSLQGLDAALPISALLSSLTSGGGGSGGGGPPLLQTPEQQQQQQQSRNLINYGGGGMGCLGNATYSDVYLNEAEHGASGFESYLYGGGGGCLEAVDLAGSRDSTELGFGLEEYEMPMLPPSSTLYLDAEMMNASTMCFY